MTDEEEELQQALAMSLQQSGQSQPFQQDFQGYH
jgi:hypothetical protein